MVFVGTFTGIVLPVIRAELVEVEILVISVGDILSVLSVLFIFGFLITEVDCV